MIAQDGRALMLGDQPVLQVVFVNQRPFAVGNPGQTAQIVVGAGDRAGVGQGFAEQASGAVTLIKGDQWLLVRVIRIRVFDLLQQAAVEVVAVASLVPSKPTS